MEGHLQGPSKERLLLSTPLLVGLSNLATTVLSLSALSLEPDKGSLWMGYSFLRAEASLPGVAGPLKGPFCVSFGS